MRLTQCPRGNLQGMRALPQQTPNRGSRAEDSPQGHAPPRASSRRGISLFDRRSREHSWYTQRPTTCRLFGEGMMEDPLTVVKDMLCNPPLQPERGTPTDEWLRDMEHLVNTMCRDTRRKLRGSPSCKTAPSLDSRGTDYATDLNKRVPTRDLRTCPTRWPRHVEGQASETSALDSAADAATTRTHASMSSTLRSDVVRGTTLEATELGAMRNHQNPHTRPCPPNASSAGQHHGSMPSTSLADAPPSPRGSMGSDGSTSFGRIFWKGMIAPCPRGSSSRSTPSPYG